MSIRLYTFWRSQAAYRVRIALALKGIEYEAAFIDLLKARQFDESYRALNPGAAVPTMIDGDGPPLVQSLAILEYLEEKQPDPPLLPSDIRMRAHARAIAQILAADTHPLIVPRVRSYLEKEIDLDEPTRMKWLKHWLEKGSHAVESLLAGDGRTGKFCCGDRPTLADLCLVPHVTTATMLYDFDLAAFPHSRRIFDACMRLDAFSKTHPTRQPDYPQSK